MMEVLDNPLNILSLRVRTALERTAGVISLNACPQREKKVTLRHRWSPTAKSTAVQTMQEKQGDRDASNVSKVILRIARDCDLGRSGSARDVLHWEGESEIVAEN